MSLRRVRTVNHSPVQAQTFPDLLAGAARQDAGRPLVTFYDDATGERVELSVTTYANWVAKTACLVQDELDVAPGGLVLLDLPPHWLGAVWLGAAWTVGLVVTADPDLAEECDLVVCGPAGVASYAGLAGGRPVVALSLRPLGAPFAEDLPAGVLDYGQHVLGQPDVFLPSEPPAGDTPALRTGTHTLSQQALVSDATARSPVSPGGRAVTDLDPCSPEGVRLLLGALGAGAGTVWVANADEARWARRCAEERATEELRAGAD